MSDCNRCRDSEGDTILIHLVRFDGLGPTELSNLISQYQALINQQNAKGVTSLMVACQRKEPDINLIKLLLSMGADPNILSAGGESALENLVYHSDEIRITEMLLDHGAQIDMTTNRGQTALHYAAGGGNLKNVELLLRRGANKKIKDNHGNKSTYFASKNERGAIKKFIENYYPSANNKNYHLQNQLTRRNILTLAAINRKLHLFPQDIERMIYPYLLEEEEKKTFFQKLFGGTKQKKK